VGGGWWGVSQRSNAATKQKRWVTYILLRGSSSRKSRQLSQSLPSSLRDNRLYADDSVVISVEVCFREGTSLELRNTIATYQFQYLSQLKIE
jgi:hypothetical protein